VRPWPPRRAGGHRVAGHAVLTAPCAGRAVGRGRTLALYFVAADDQGHLALYRFSRRPRPSLTLLYSSAAAGVPPAGRFAALHMHLDRRTETTDGDGDDAIEVVRTVYLVALTRNSKAVVWQLRATERPVVDGPKALRPRGQAGRCKAVREC